MLNKLKKIISKITSVHVMPVVVAGSGLCWTTHLKSIGVITLVSSIIYIVLILKENKNVQTN